MTKRELTRMKKKVETLPAPARRKAHAEIRKIERLQREGQRCYSETCPHTHVPGHTLGFCLWTGGDL